MLKELINKYPILGIIFTFFIVIALFIIIPLLYEFIRKKFLNKNLTDDYEKDKDKIESRIYEYLYSKEEASIKELENNIQTSKESLIKYLYDLSEKDIIIINENKVQIKKESKCK